MQPKVEINQGLMKIIYNLPQAGQYPLFPDDHVLSCRAIDMCHCFATPFKYSYCFLSFQIHDNENDFRGTAQYGLMLSHLYFFISTPSHSFLLVIVW